MSESNPFVEIVGRILDGQAPANVRAAAARGALPLPRTTLVRLQVFLLKDPDEEIRKSAKQALEGLDSETIKERKKKTRKIKKAALAQAEAASADAAAKEAEAKAETAAADASAKEAEAKAEAKAAATEEAPAEEKKEETPEDKSE